MPSNKGHTIPSSPVVKKMTVAQSKEIVEKQDVIIKTLQQHSAYRENMTKVLEEKVTHLKGRICRDKSLHFVRDRVTENQTS